MRDLAADDHVAAAAAKEVPPAALHRIVEAVAYVGDADVRLELQALSFLLRMKLTTPATASEP